MQFSNMFIARVTTINILKVTRNAVHHVTLYNSIINYLVFVFYCNYTCILPVYITLSPLNKYGLTMHSRVEVSGEPGGLFCFCFEFDFLYIYLLFLWCFIYFLDL